VNAIIVTALSFVPNQVASDYKKNMFRDLLVGVSNENLVFQLVKSR